MSLILTMIGKNVPLCQWRKFVDSGDVGKGFYSGGKMPAKIAQAIFSSLSHPDAVVLVAKEFPELSQQVRLCNSGNATGNVRKGVQRLNEMLLGELLREKQHVEVTNRRVEGVNGAYYKRDRVNPAVAGAKRKYQLT